MSLTPSKMKGIERVREDDEKMIKRLYSGAGKRTKREKLNKLSLDSVYVLK